MKIPLIDFADCGLLIKDDHTVEYGSLLNVGNLLYEALSTVGFAYISNTGVSRELIDDVHEIADEFFSQPMEYKMEFCTKQLGLCYDPIGALRLNPDKPCEYQEGLRAYTSSGEIPGIPKFRVRIGKFESVCRILLLRIMKVLGAAMKLKDPDLLYNSHQKLNTEGNTTCVKLLRYPPFPDGGIVEGQMRINEHTDFGSVTLLFQDEIGGLQAQIPGGDFVDVPPIPDTVVLNVGDMMEFWSAGRLKSTIHRVAFPNDDTKRQKIRRSITYFGTIDNEVLLDELEIQGSVKTKQKKQNKTLMTSKEYVDKRFQNAYY